MGIRQLIRKSNEISVLYIENNFQETSTKVKLLKTIFPNIHLAHNGQEGLDAFLEFHSTHGNYFDLVITELNLPIMSGLQMLDQMKLYNNNQRTLIVSDYARKEEFIDIIELGIDGYLPKPINLTRCISLLEKIVDRITFSKQKEIRLSFVDNLTKLENRSALLKRLEQDEASTIMIIDVDTIEHINLIYGYEVGNIVLKEFSQFLNTYCAEKNYVLYKVENETFVIYDTSEFINFSEFERNFNELLERTKFHKVKVMGMNIDFDTTMGIVMCQDKAFAKANLALARAKQENKKFFTYHNEFKEHEPIEYTMKWRESIKQAIYNKEIVPFYQPIVNKKQEIIKYEALMRIKQVVGDETNYISPIYFLDTAVKTKQYEALSTEMIKQVLDQLEVCDAIISINVSYYDIKEIGLLNIIQELIKTKNTDICSRLIIEIIETSNISECEYCIEFIQVAKQAGIKIAIDDFGTGYSNFTHILDIKPDYLKIDGSLIKNIHKDENALALVKAIVEFSRKLNIKLIAEFVHNKDVFDVVKKLGIDEFQGYYFGEPKKHLGCN
ncbi:hypothetical protein A9Q76_03060 [Arcobacter sp. 31_11_sub10_T18]|nr:hypothetical protein A9Q76_03060 [Arcobacter sp. 31_11_sub10_T18]